MVSGRGMQRQRRWWRQWLQQQQRQQLQQWQERRRQQQRQSCKRANAPPSTRAHRCGMDCLLSCSRCAMILRIWLLGMSV